jgi:hypothetical protein
MAEDKKDKTVQNEEDNLRDYRGESAMQVINVLLDPTNNILMSVSRLSSRKEALLLSLQVAKEATIKLEDNPRAILTSTIWREAYLRLLRSVGGKTLGWGFGYAAGQQSVDADEPIDKWEGT